MCAWPSASVCARRTWIDQVLRTIRSEMVVRVCSTDTGPSRWERTVRRVSWSIYAFVASGQIFSSDRTEKLRVLIQHRLDMLFVNNRVSRQLVIWALHVFSLPGRTDGQSEREIHRLVAFKVGRVRSRRHWMSTAVREEEESHSSGKYRATSVDRRDHTRVRLVLVQRV